MSLAMLILLFQSRRPAAWVAVACALATLPAPAKADPAGELLRLAPADTSICLVVHDLRGHARELAGSPFADWLEQSPLSQRFADPKELAKITALETFLSAQFGVTPDQLLDDVLGDAVVLAYQPGPPGKPDAESGVLLVRARKPDVLARLVGKLNEFQQKSGEIKAVREKAHRGRPYFEREKAAGGREYYLLRDGVLAFSGQERAVRGVIEQDLTAPPASQDPGRVAAGLRRAGVADTFLACWFDPRGFDADLKAKMAAAKDPGEKAFLTRFADVWAATEAVALYAHPSRGLELGVVAAVDREKLPKEVRDAVPRPGGSVLWAAVPDDALFAAGGRIDLPRLLAAAGAFLPDDGQAKLKAALEQGLGAAVGRDKLPAVIAGLGPDWAVWATPPRKGDGTWVPGWTAALKLSGEGVAPAVLQGLDTAAALVRFAYNREHTDQLELSQESQDGVAVRVLSNGAKFPPGFRPAYAVKQGYLVLASSPESVRRFAAPAAGPTADPPLLRVSATHLRGYLTEHRAVVAKAVAGWSGKSAKEVEKGLDDLLAVLEAFDKVELHQSAGAGTVRLSLHIDFVKPLTR